MTTRNAAPHRPFASTPAVVALIGLALSLSMPLSGTGASAGDRIALILMHLTVGAVLIPGLARTVGNPT